MSALLAFAARLRLSTVLSYVVFIILLASITAARHYRDRAEALEAALTESNTELAQCSKSNAEARGQLATVRAASDKLAAEAAAAARDAGARRLSVERALATKAAALVATSCEAAITELATELAQEPTQ